MGTRPGHLRFVHQHIVLLRARPRTKTAWEAFNEGTGVCRDYSAPRHHILPLPEHPARYCTGYWVTSVHSPHTADGFRRLVRGMTWTVIVQFLMLGITCRVSASADRGGVAMRLMSRSATVRPNTLGAFKVWAEEVSGGFP